MRAYDVDGLRRRHARLPRRRGRGRPTPRVPLAGPRPTSTPSARRLVERRPGARWSPRPRARRSRSAACCSPSTPTAGRSCSTSGRATEREALRRTAGALFADVLGRAGPAGRRRRARALRALGDARGRGPPLRHPLPRRRLPAGPGGAERGGEADRVALVAPAGRARAVRTPGSMAMLPPHARDPRRARAARHRGRRRCRCAAPGRRAPAAAAVPAAATAGRVAARARPHARDPRRRRTSRTRARPTGRQVGGDERARRAARRRRAVDGRGRDRPAAVRAGREPGPDDARRHQHLGAARSPAPQVAVVVDPGPATAGAPRRDRGRAVDGRARACGCCSPTGTPTTPRARPTSPSAWARRWPRSTRRTGSATRAWSTATSWSRSAASRSPSSRTPGHTGRLAVLPPARRRRAAHRRHRARPRLDRGRAPRRAPRRLPRTRCERLRAAGGGDRGGARAARARAGARRPCRRGGGVPRSTAQARLEQVRAALAAGAVDAPMTWSRWCTPTCPARSGRPPALRAGAARVPRPRLTRRCVTRTTSRSSSSRVDGLAGAALQALDVEQHDRARLQAQPAARGEVGERLVDRLAARRRRAGRAPPASCRA